MWFSCGTNVPIGYHPRIFIVETNDDQPNLAIAHSYLKEMCIWGGADKVWNEREGFKGTWYGYEIRKERYSQCVRFLTRCLGEPIDPSTLREV